MTLRWISIIIAIAVIACSSETGQRGPLGKEKFAAVLADLAVEESSYARNLNVDSAGLDNLAKRNARVLQQHKISREQFLRTYSYYQREKKEMMEIYDLALAELMKKQEAIRLEKSAVRDTVAN